MLQGFSFGIDDEDLTKTEYGQIDEVLKGAISDVERRIKIFKEGQLEPMPGRTLEETLEMQIMQVLGKARDRTGEIAGRHLGMDNSAVVMAVSGARGSMLNLTQVAGCLGQQSVRGERIMRGYEGRTLPHFRRNELGAEAHGLSSIVTRAVSLQPSSSSTPLADVKVSWTLRFGRHRVATCSGG